MNPSQGVTIRVLGPIDARREGRPVAIPGATPRAILTLLALNAGKAVPANVVEDLLWADDPPRTARKALQTHIAVLRRALGPGVIASQGRGWTLTTDAVDAHEFATSAQKARDAVAADAPAAALPHFAAARDAWRGPPVLPETTRGQGEVTRWTESYNAVVDDHTDALLECGRAADVVGELEAAVIATPLRERRWAQLCLALYRTGRQAEALRTYQRARGALVEEIGVEPGPELRQLEAAMLAQDAALDIQPRHPRHRPADVRASAGNLPRSPTTFIGRRQELAQLRDLIAAHRTIAVVGPGGVGKTRLAIAAASEAALEFPAGVWFVDLEATTHGVVTEEVAASLGLEERPGAPLDEMIQRQFADEAGLLVLDNCEHVVEAVGTFVQRLIRDCPTVTVIVTTRERLGIPGEHVLAVLPLPVGPTSDAAALFVERARAADPDFEASADLVAEICDRCDGLPLAIELAAARCASLGVDGLLSGLDDRLRFLVGTSQTRQGRHGSLRAVLGWSHDHLDDDEQVLFRRLGVFVGSFDVSAATAVDGAHTSAAVVDVVGRLTDKNLLVYRRSPTGSRWHMLNVVRSYARERLAEAGDQTVVDANFLTWAARLATALERQLDLGEPWRAEFDLVVGDLRTALFMDGDGDRLALALPLARLYARSGAFTLAQSAYEKAMALARTTGSPAQLARAALGASVSGMLFGVNRAERVALLEDALAALGQESESGSGSGMVGMRARLLARLATELYWGPNRARSRELAADAATLADDCAEDEVLAHALYAQHYVSRNPDNVAERLSTAKRLIRVAHRGGDTQLELAGRAAHAVDHLELGDLREFERGVEQLAGAADRFDYPEFQWYAAVYRVVQALISGRYDDADELATATRQRSRLAPEFAVGLSFAQAVTDLRAFEDRRPEERSVIAEMAERFPRVLVWRCLQSLDELACGRVTSAHGLVGEMCDELLADPERDGHWLVGCSLLAEAVAVLDDTELAARLQPALRPYADRLAVAGRVAAFRGSVSHTLGLLAATSGDVEGAAADLQRAVDIHHELGARPFEARSRVTLERLSSGGR